MSKEDTIRKLYKLQQMYQRGSGPERQNAKRLMDMLMEKHGINITELEEVSNFPVKIRKECVKYASHIALSMSIGLYSYKKPSGMKEYLIKCTKIERDIYLKALKNLEKLFSYQLKQLKIELDSFLCGFVSKAYRVTKAPQCPDCNSELFYDDNENRYKCTNCNWKGKRSGNDVDFDSYIKGIESSGRLLTEN